MIDQPKPPLSILDKQFVYRNAAQTNVALTFARVRRQMREQQKQTATVRQLRKTK